MDGHPTSRFFLEPKEPLQRQYEAFRAIFIDGQPLDRVAERLGYKASALRSMASRFRTACDRGEPPPFFDRTAAADRPAPLPLKSTAAPSCPRSQTSRRWTSARGE